MMTQTRTLRSRQLFWLACGLGIHLCVLANMQKHAQVVEHGVANPADRAFDSFHRLFELSLANGEVAPAPHELLVDLHLTLTPRTLEAPLMPLGQHLTLPPRKPSLWTTFAALLLVHRFLDTVHYAQAQPRFTCYERSCVGFDERRGRYEISKRASNVQMPSAVCQVSCDCCTITLGTLKKLISSSVSQQHYTLPGIHL